MSAFESCTGGSQTRGTGGAEPRRYNRAGFSLIELLISLVMLGLIMGSTVMLFRSQSTSFRVGGQRLEMTQNGRYALATIDRVLRTAGAGVANQQPMFIYGGNDVVAFNTNYVSTTTDNCAVNINPDAPAGSVDVLPVGSAGVLPNTAFVYPAMTYAATSCRAETIVFYFTPDLSTTTSGDFVLMQRTNVLAPELVASNLEAYPGRPFFEYYVHPRSLTVPPATRDSLVLANNPGSGITLPIVHNVAVHGAVADSAGSTSALADSVKAVRINVRVTNGLTGVDRRTRDLSMMVKLHNNGLVQLRSCGTRPILTGVLTTTPNVAGDPPAVTLTWPASIDEASGETDVTQYNIYRRLQADPSFGSPLNTVPSGGVATYTFADGGVIAGETYVYAVVAQDCSPAESAALVSAPVSPL